MVIGPHQSPVWKQVVLCMSLMHKFTIRHDFIASTIGGLPAAYPQPLVFEGTSQATLIHPRGPLRIPSLAKNTALVDQVINFHKKKHLTGKNCDFSTSGYHTVLGGTSRVSTSILNGSPWDCTEVLPDLRTQYVHISGI